MLRTPVAEALGAASAASEIRIGGWVRTRRDAKGFRSSNSTTVPASATSSVLLMRVPPHGTNWKASTRARASPLRANLSSRPAKARNGKCGLRI